MVATDEARLAARRAILAMLSIPPMPAGVALDMIQDVTDDRREAALVFYGVAADHLRGLAPVGDPDDVSSSRQRIRAACAHIKGGNLFSVAEEHVEAMWEAHDTRRHDYILAGIGTRNRPAFNLHCAYRKWATEARRVLAACRATEEASR